MDLKPWRPLQDVDDLFSRYTRLLNNRLPAMFDENGNGRDQWAPSADISETKKEYLIKADLPDVEKSDIHVCVDNGRLVIEGERKHREEEKDETVHRIESFYGKFYRSFSLPDNVDTANIKADCRKGVLRVHVPKIEAAKPKPAIEVKVT